MHTVVYQYPRQYKLGWLGRQMVKMTGGGRKGLGTGLSKYPALKEARKSWELSRDLPTQRRAGQLQKAGDVLYRIGFGLQGHEMFQAPFLGLGGALHQAGSRMSRRAIKAKTQAQHAVSESIAAERRAQATRRRQIGFGVGSVGAAGFGGHWAGGSST